MSLGLCFEVEIIRILVLKKMFSRFGVSIGHQLSVETRLILEDSIPDLI